ncbi:hypothetical protein BU14_0033s0024, partial [Porphyra umbilicalis]
MGAVQGVEAAAAAHAAAVKAAAAKPTAADRRNGAAPAPPLPWYAASVPVDDLGVRVPAFLAAITKSPYGASVSAPILASATAEFRAYAARLLGAIPPADREHPPPPASNWALYHGHLALYCAAIEGEGSTATGDALDPTVHALFSQLTENYVEYALHDSGHPIEDAYALNLGFREGSLALLALARRGANLFRHPKYQALWKSVLPHLLEARPGGEVKLLGGSSGNAWQYLTSIVVAKWAMPQEPLIDWLYGVLSGAAPVDPKARGKAPAGATVAYPRLNSKWQ